MFGNSKKDEEREMKAGLALADFSNEVTSHAYRWRVFFRFGILITASWLIVLLIPNLIVRFLFFAGISKITLIPIVFVFSLSTYLGYTVAVHLIPGLEENKSLNNDVFESIGYQNAANRRYMMWIAAILFGLINTGLLFGAAFLLHENGLYLFELEN